MDENLILAVGTAALAVLLFWAWLTWLELFASMLMALAGYLYFAFWVAVVLEERERLSSYWGSDDAAAAPQKAKQPEKYCTSLN